MNVVYIPCLELLGIIISSCGEGCKEFSGEKNANFLKSNNTIFPLKANYNEINYFSDIYRHIGSICEALSAVSNFKSESKLFLITIIR